MEQVSIEQKKLERLEEWKIWIADYLELNGSSSAPVYIPITHAAELLNDYYWRLTLNFLKPLLDFSKDELDHNLHYYKIISASELTIMAVMPFSFQDRESGINRKRVNAEFAWFVAISIMLNWKIDGKTLVEPGQLEKAVSYQEKIHIEDGKEKLFPDNLREEHIHLMANINTATALPILSNSHTWRAIFIAATLSDNNILHG